MSLKLCPNLSVNLVNTIPGNIKLKQYSQANYNYVCNYVLYIIDHVVIIIILLVDW